MNMMDEEPVEHEEGELNEIVFFEKGNNLNSPIHSASENEEDQHTQQLLESDEVDTGAPMERKNKEIKLKKDMSLVSIVAMVVGAIIGSGIFFTPPAVLRNSGSFGVSMVVWSMGALLAVAGGLCYCELSLLMKNSGGDYWYLKQVYQFGRLKKVCGIVPLFFLSIYHTPSQSPTSLIGALIAFLYIWTSAFILRPASVAIICRVFGLYLATAIAGGNDPPQASAVMIAVAAISECCCDVVATLPGLYTHSVPGYSELLQC